GRRRRAESQAGTRAAGARQRRPVPVAARQRPRRRDDPVHLPRGRRPGHAAVPRRRPGHSARTGRLAGHPGRYDDPGLPARRAPAVRIGQMPKSEFVYVTYIKTTPDKLWHALTDPDVMKQWRFGTHAESDWSVGSSWKMITEAGQILDTGEIIESNPPTSLTIK